MFRLQVLPFILIVIFSYIRLLPLIFRRKRLKLCVLFYMDNFNYITKIGAIFRKRLYRLILAKKFEFA